MVIDIVRVLGWRIGAMVGLSMAMVAARVATFGGFIAYVHGRTSGETGSAEWLSYLPPVSETGLWALFIFVSGIAMGVLGYLETRYRLATGVTYSISVMRRVLEMLASRGDELDYLWKRSPRYLTSVVAGDSGILVRAVLPIVSSIQPLVQFAAAGAILAVMSWQLALVIVGFGICYVLPYMNLNRRVIRTARAMEENRATAAVPRAVDDLVRRLRYPQYGGQVASDGIDSLVTSDALRDRLKVTMVLRTNTSIIQLLNSAFISLFIVTFLFAVDWFEPGRATVQMLAYATALVHAYNAANQLTSNVAVFNRFFSRFDRIVEILRHPELRGAPPAGTRTRAPKQVTLRPTAAARLKDSAARVALEPDAGYLVLQPQMASVANLGQWLLNLRFPRDLAPGALFLVPPPRDLPEATVAQMLTGTHAPTPEALEMAKPLLSLEWVANWVQSLPQGLDTHWSALDPKPGHGISLALGVAPALQERPRYIVLPGELWRCVLESYRTDIMRCIPGASWLVSSNRPAPMAELPFEQVIVATQSGVTGIGSSQWLAERLAENLQLFAEEEEEERTGAPVDDMEELM